MMAFTDIDITFLSKNACSTKYEWFENMISTKKPLPFLCKMSFIKKNSWESVLPEPKNMTLEISDWNF